jgi:hypothetical protein
MKWIVLALLVSINTAWAQDAKLSNNEFTAWSAVQEELTSCTAYWQRFKACAPENAPKAELEKVDRIIKQFSDLSFDVGNKIGMTVDAMLSRLTMAIEEQNKLTGDKCVNFASLTTRYLTRCKALAEKPDATFREYMAK